MSDIEEYVRLKKLGDHVSPRTPPFMVKAVLARRHRMIAEIEARNPKIKEAYARYRRSIEA